MTTINQNLNNLFNNYQNTQNRKDVTGDGKFNSKDRQALSKEKTNLLNESGLFDITGDGKVTQEDLDLFQTGFDIDGDGKISNMEKNFEKTYLSNMVSTMKKEGTTFTYNGYTYTGGKLASGVVDGKYYQNGKLASGTVKDGTKTTVYKNGEVSYSTDVTTTDTNGYPKITGNKVILANGSTITLKDGAKFLATSSDGLSLLQVNKNIMTIKADGSISNCIVDGKLLYEQGLQITSVASSAILKDFNITSASTDSKGRMLVDGKLASGVYDGKLYASGNLKTGSATIKEDGKNVTYMFKDGVKANGLVNGKMYADGKTFTGVADDGLYYANGSLKTGTITSGNTKTNYKNGVMQYSITDNNNTFYPNATNNKITFADKKTSITLATGDKAEIKADGSVGVYTKVNDSTEKITIYDRNGKVLSTQEIWLGQSR